MSDSSASESPNVTYYCHACERNITPNLSDYTCPRCNSGFIERIERPTNPFLGTSIFELSEEPSTADNVGPSVMRIIQDMVAMEHALFNMPSGTFGDYAFGPQGLDNVITQLLNQLEGQGGTPPLTPDQIQALPQLKVTAEMREKSPQCSVCMEDFQTEEIVRKLTCDHFFHDTCIVPWLERHATCPVCRKELGSGQPRNPQRLLIRTRSEEPTHGSAPPPPIDPVGSRPQPTQPQQPPPPPPPPNAATGEAPSPRTPEIVPGKRAHSTVTGPELILNKASAVSPQKLVESDLSCLADAIKGEILEHLEADEVKALSTYHFDGKGKAIRPLIVLLTARCINHHMGNEELSQHQRYVAMIAEMIHTASLIHDDVIDESDIRRGRPTLSSLCGQKKAILIGDCVLAISSLLLARIGHADVYRIISQILTDLVQGEFMQMENPAKRVTQSDRFAHYLEKSFKKTASLMARPCEAVGVLARLPPKLQETVFLFGRNLGMAFQLVDDLLDFECDSQQLGKPAMNDLRSGIATGPVLLAAESHPELYEMIGRRFNRDGDVEKAYHLVVDESDAILRARNLAESYGASALRYLHLFKDSEYRRGLEAVIDQILTRRK
ncbi:unnamed protein product [Notodromas monacha]|uniref:RING-type E3 ubiquitin transferase n=1 Tax=Notodromas monacha TaxID=399045 RepID=A0A7R9BKY9_9CRUS|nr:unnamed protein product [Notodromas monacha]CAG0916091.1 unnamed protein product [Notodromas monacha]